MGAYARPVEARPDASAGRGHALRAPVTTLSNPNPGAPRTGSDWPLASSGGYSAGLENFQPASERLVTKSRHHQEVACAGCGNIGKGIAQRGDLFSIVKGATAHKKMAWVSGWSTSGSARRWCGSRIGGRRALHGRGAGARPEASPFPNGRAKGRSAKDALGRTARPRSPTPARSPMVAGPRAASSSNGAAGNFQAAKEGWLKTIACHPNLSGADCAVAVLLSTYFNSRTSRDMAYARHAREGHQPQHVDGVAGD